MDRIERLCQWETHPSRVLYAYRDDTGTSPRFDLCDDPSGPWFIERNHYGFLAYVTGVKFDDPVRRRLGIEALDYGLARQDEQGGFPCEDAHHSAAFYLEALARFLLLAPRTGAGDVERFRRGLIGGTLWFHTRSTWNDDWWRDTFHHRFFLNSAVLFLAWEALPGILPLSVLEQAYAWAAEGIRRQRADGAITEFGGHDTGYHSLGVTFMAGTLLLSTLHPDFRRELDTCLRRAADWLMGRVDADGRIDAAGNARMSPASGEKSRETGQAKGVKFYETAFALSGAGLYLQDRRCLDVAEQVMRRGRDDRDRAVAH